MASTRSTSPAGSAHSAEDFEMSPRSKIQAMLAKLDEDSEDEDTGPINRKKLFQSLKKPTTTEKEATPAEGQQDDEDADDDEEEEILRPHGRLAAHMHGLETELPLRTTHSRSPSPKRISEPTVKPTSNEEDQDEDEDEDIVSFTHTRRARQIRSATPETAPNALDAISPASSGLFVSPSPKKHLTTQRPGAGSDSEEDEDLPVDLSKNARFQALVARKREERLAKEREEERKREERAKRVAEQVAQDDDDDDVSDITDDDEGRRLTQKNSRPAPRKASKKALEEMNRETERLKRSLQLAHEAKTKKKISKASLFERFNFKAPGSEAEASKNKLSSSSRPSTPVSGGQTDVEMGEAGTPPSSPPSAVKRIETAPTAALPEAQEREQQQTTIQERDKVELPSLEDVFNSTQKLDKGKGKARLAEHEVPPKDEAVSAKPKRHFRVKLPPVQAHAATIDLDDDLEIIGTKKDKLDAIFDRVPANRTSESRSIHTLRQLAHLSSPPQDARKKNQKPAMNLGELQLTLQQKARAQAKLERERRLEMLKAKGITVQTEEEREKEREQVEDIVARARQEAEEIMAREREAAKQARRDKRKNGEEDPLGWDDSDDDSYADEQPSEPEEGGLSGSDADEEDDDGADSEGEDDEERAGNPMFDEDAEEEEEEPENPANISEDVAGDEDEEMEDILPAHSRRLRTKPVTIVSDDEEDRPAATETPKPKTTVYKSPSGPRSDSPKAPTSVLRSATKPFIPGLPVPVAAPAGLGLTQIFQGTMDDTQDGDEPELTDGSPVEFMPSFDAFPNSQFSATAGQSQDKDAMVLDSQHDTQKQETQTQAVQINFEQSQVHGFDSLMQEGATQMSEMLEPTQDPGYGDYTPLKQRWVEAPQSTVATVIVGEDEEMIHDSPLVRKKGHLMRRAEMAADEDASYPPTEKTIPAPSREDEPVNSNVSAFKLMKAAAKRKKRFDAKKSKAKDMVEVQAEESEDEYAGLGGADGEESSDEERDELQKLHKEIIDDAAGNDVDEAKLAALFAERDRAEDSARVDKLFHDITTGMLRKRRRGGNGNDFDLSDSDDDGEARRRMKRRQFAKMQKALFADERIGKIAENPRNAAFLKSIEDRDSDDDLEIEENVVEEAVQESQESQNRSASDERIPDSQPSANVGRNRTRQDPVTASGPASNARRAKDTNKPSSLAEVRRTLSSLIEDPNASAGSVIPATQLGSDEEDEDGDDAAIADKENHHPNTVHVVDRITLKRSGSTNLSNGSTSSTSRLAFAAPASSSSAPGMFKMPSLLRRATTNSLMSTTSSSTSSTGVTTGHHTSKAGGFGDEAKIKKNAGKKSGVNYFARENERRAKIRETEMRREAKKFKGFEGRGSVVKSLFGGGTFE